MVIIARFFSQKTSNTESCTIQYFFVTCGMDRNIANYYTDAGSMVTQIQSCSSYSYFPNTLQMLRGDTLWSRITVFYQADRNDHTQRTIAAVGYRNDRT